MRFAVSRFLKLASAQLRVRSYVTRDIGQPTNYTHPETIAPGEILPGMNASEFAGRRQLLMEELSQTHSGMTNDKHLVVIPAATVRYMTNDIFHRFHQNNDFLYLTGFHEPDSVLLLHTDSGLPSHKAILYVNPRNPVKEKWEGPVAGPGDAVEFLGVDEAFDLFSLPSHIEERYRGYGYSVWYYGERDMPSIISKDIQDLIWNKLIRSPDAKITSMHSLVHHLQNLRAVKSPSEINLLRKAGEIGVNGFKQAISSTRPDLYEYQIESLFQHSCMVEGAQRLSFVPVVAGDDRGCHLHYTTNRRRLEGDSLVLMDAGCEYYGYVSDITRTWPVNGSFKPVQRDLYEIILRIKNTCIEECRPGVTLNYLHSISKELMAMELKALGVVPMNLDGSTLANVINGLYPHDIGHYMGMDVHDCPLVSHNVPLVPGMVLTIEPGVYIHRAFPIKDKLKKELKGTAIRIEDNVLVTENGCEILNKNCPETIDELCSLQQK